MNLKMGGVTGSAIKQAIESRDGRMLASFYADDAVVRVIDRNNPPSRPREVRGKSAITTFWDDICSRAMTHEVNFSAAEGDRLAFSQACTYPDGAKVFCLAMLELKNGKIAHQTLVQAWDE
ncbi:MAG: nuclear transport factor 2 family protein [Hyphomicrobiales bacterium]|nr:nuclear transport factor 2 family protein [Hyphomicrobiales bacterium]